MRKGKKILLLLFLISVFISVQAQKDSSDMRLDIGWTRDKDINIWPILKFKKDTSIGFVKTELLFSIYQYGRVLNINEKYSHFYPLWRRKSNADGSDFRLFSTFYPSVFHKNNNLKTGIKSFDFLEIAPGVSALGVSKSKDGLYIDNNLLFLLWFNKNEVEKSSHLIFFPVYWSFKNPRAKTNTFFPFWSTGHYYQTGFKYTAVTPLFLHTKRDSKSGNFLFPFYWNSKDNDSINPWKTNVLFPIWYSYSDNYRKSQILFPFAYRFKKPESQSFTLLPVYSLSKDSANARKLLMITPIYWYIKSYSEKTRVLLPLWISYTDEYKKNRTLLPFIFYQKNWSYRSFTFLPLFSYGSDSLHKRKHFAITPVYWHFKEQNKIINTVFPLFWDIKSISEVYPKHRTVLFPLLFRFKDNDHNRFTFFPLLFVLNNPDYKSFTLLPLTSFGRSPDSTRRHLSIGTIFWQFKSEKDTARVFFPIWWYRNYSRWDGKYQYNVLFPLYWTFKNPDHINKVFFPITWNIKNPKYYSYTFVPLFSFGHSPPRDKNHLIISPFFWRLKNREEKTTALFPFLWYTKTDGQTPSKRIAVFPVWWSYSDSVTRNRILFPIIWRFKNDEYTSTTIFPLLSSGKNMEGSQTYSIITPLYWRFKNEQSQSTLFFPFFDSKTYKNGNRKFGLFFFLYRFKKEDSLKRADFIWPICQYKSTTNHKSFHIAPLIWYKKTDESKFFSIQPLYYQIKSDKYADYHFFWQLFTFKNTFEKEKSWNFLWKFLYYKKYEPKGHEFRFIYLVFADVKKDSLVEKSFLPFYYFSKENNGNRSLSLFFYFYNSVKRKLPNSIEFYKEERIFWFIRLRSNYKRLKAEGKI